MKDFIFLCCTLALLITSGCNRPNVGAASVATVALSDTLQRMVVLDTVHQVPVMNELRLTAKVTFDPNRVVSVFPLVGGQVDAVFVELGQHVSQGQVLATLKSGEIADFEEQLVEAESDRAVAQKNLNVAEDLFAAKLNAQRDLLIAKEEFQKASARVGKLKQLLSIYSAGNNAQYRVLAPASGYVVAKNVVPGIQIRPDNASSLFTITSLNDVFVLANVYETDIARVKVGQPVEIKALAYGERIFTGRVDQILDVIDPDTRTLKARIRLPNPDRALKPEMFASVTIRYPEARTLPSVLASALVFDNSRYYVVVKTKAERFEVREVLLESIVSGKAYLKSGAIPGERVVCQNALLIYNAL